MRLRVGVDVGGTFTDLVCYDRSSGRLIHLKVLTTPSRPVKGVLKALHEVDLSEVEVLAHASTLGTNFFFGQEGLKVPEAVLITNKGFRDVLEIGRQNRPEIYNLFFRRPPPLIPRDRRVEVSCRMDAEGRELIPLNEEEVRRIARRFSCEVYIVSFLHSFVNPEHELRAKRVIEEERPGVVVVVSHEVDPQPGEYERTSTAVVDALLRPLLSKYIEELERELRNRGFRGRLLLMQSSGGAATPEEVFKRPALFIESGPAAGAVATAHFSRLMGIEKAIGFDMGGTTAKASSIVGGQPEVVGSYEVGGKVHMGRLVRGSGYPVRHPCVDLAEVSAGGGTVAWIDPGGLLRVGPRSSGADPGPACYGRGGKEPTVTDANLLLGRLPRSLAGGRVLLDEKLAERAMSSLAERLEVSTEEVAWSIIRLANVVMGRALRIVTVERGHDPREFVLFAFGGAGPLHAAELSMELGVRRIVVPPMPGVFSALGLLVSDYRCDLHAPFRDPDEVEETFRSLEERARRILGGDPVITRFLEVRYRGQGYSLPVPYTNLEQAMEEFHNIHAARYGFSSPEEEVEPVLLRIQAFRVVEKPSFLMGKEEEHRPEPFDERMVRFSSGWEQSRIYRRAELRPGATFEGPAIVESDDSTVVVPPGVEVRVHSTGSILMEVSS